MTRTRHLGTTLAIALVAAGALGALAPLAPASVGAPTAHAEVSAAPQSPTARGGDAKVSAPLPVTPDPGFFGKIMTWIAGLFAWLLGVAILLLDYTVYYSVVTMGTVVKNLAAIGVSWRILRDIGNIALIFGFLASGIMVIVNASYFGFGSKMLPMLLVAAVFLNFSLFISEAIIDVGNLFATEIFVQINGGQFPTKAFEQGFTTAVHNEGISNRIMSVLGLQSIYNDVREKTQGSGSPDSIAAAKQFNESPWFIGFMSILLFIIAAFVMFSLAFILIARFAALIFLIVVAPIGFAGLAIPKLSGLANQWWGHLVEQTITAPVLLLLLYVALAVITDANFLIGFGGGPGASYIASTVNPTPRTITESGSVFFSFLVAMALLLAVVVVAKRLSAFGASGAMKLGGMASFGAVSFAGRATLGSAGNLLASKRMQAMTVAREGEGRAKRALRYSGRLLTFTGKGLRAGTYDPRNAPGTGAGLSALGIDAGKGATVTARQLAEQQYGYKPTAAFFREAEKGYQQAAADVDRKAKLNSGSPADVQAELRRMSDDEIAELRGIRRGLDNFVQALGPTAYGNLMKNKSVLQSEKNNIKKSWDAQFANVATASTALGRMSEEERVALGGSTLANPNVLVNLNADDFDNIRSAKLLPADKTHVTTYVRGIVAGPASPLQDQINTLARLNPKFKAYYGL